MVANRTALVSIRYTYHVEGFVFDSNEFTNYCLNFKFQFSLDKQTVTETDEQVDPIA